ncbi:diacylglycerol kinase [Geothrix sp. 21YS21S-4]|uniref:diacylglycerol kinase n=1 Tax=Geothrix sp. 21YS21S-4 TaxID=3068889 RepID=UPI0027B9913E|nr:diacylglycerol kinase [Geothrix sp. 21YS21S-4]
MKNRSFFHRLGFSLSGIAAACRFEASFRTQVAMAAGVVGLLLWFRPAPVWWALLSMNCSLVLGAELFNTALEHALDHLHPDLHPSIKIAKDCAAGAVLIFSASALITFAAFLVSVLSPAPR